MNSFLFKFHEKEQQNGVMVDFNDEIVGEKMNVRENSSKYVSSIFDAFYDYIT